jgi:Histidine kinase-, DNA gyrase B-, and HSP90-like ATPase
LWHAVLLGAISLLARRRNPGFLRIAVTDTGSGIVRSEHKKIFEYLYQAENNVETNHTGLGIGLYICKELVSSHGGRIWVKSRPRHGSIFSFTLPVFSLELQLASIVKTADLIKHSIALIAVEISHIEKRPLKGKTAQAALRDAWGVLQSLHSSQPGRALSQIAAHSIERVFLYCRLCQSKQCRGAGGTAS